MGVLMAAERLEHPEGWPPVRPLSWTGIGLWTARPGTLAQHSTSTACFSLFSEPTETPASFAKTMWAVYETD